MDHFQSIQTFVTVADKRGFAAAARELAMSPPAVTRAVSALEDRLGTPLFVRTTRSVRLTDSGARFLEDARRILSDLQEAEESAVGSHAAPRGELRITAPVLFGRMFVTPLLGGFLNQHDGVTAQTLYLDRVVNIMDEGQDVAIRIGDLPDSSLSATRVGSVRRVVFGTPAYLKQNGIPRHPSDLSKHRVIQPLSMGGSRDWRFQDGDSAVHVQLQSRLRMNTNDAVIALILEGWGLSRLLSYQIAPYLKDGGLNTVLDAYEPPSLPIHVVHQEGRKASPKVRAFVDYVVAHLRQNPAIN